MHRFFRFLRTDDTIQPQAFFRMQGDGASSESAGAQTVNEFALRLFSRAALNTPNVLHSPLSVATALQLTAMGVTPASVAGEEIDALVGRHGAAARTVSTADVNFVVATSAWLSSAVLDEFKQKAEEMGADVRTNMSSVSAVNQWVSERTGGKIDTILTQLPENLVALIVSAVYFQAAWTVQFSRAETVPHEFDGVDYEVPLMRMKDVVLPYARVETSAGVVRLADVPYGRDKAFSAVVVVPADGVTVDAVVGSLRADGSQWAAWTAAMQATKLEVLALPRFELTHGAASVKSVLRDMGLHAVFTANVSAPPLAAMTHDLQAFVSDVLHLATVRCTEEGTVAAAAAAVVVQTRSLTIGGPRVVADRPFLFAIRERASGALLFVGRVDRPQVIE